MVRNLIIALALIGGAPDAFAQRREAVILFSLDDFPIGHPADPSIMRPLDLSASAMGRLPATDYPQPARRAGRTGEVQVEVRIGADDRVLDCRVTSPASSADLTAAACPLVRGRGVFRHALANDGTPREGVTRLRVTFDLVVPTNDGDAVVYMPSVAAPVAGDKSRRPEALDPDALIIRGMAPALFPGGDPFVNLSVDADGRVTRCSMFTSSGTDQGDLLACRRASAARFSPARDARGTAIASDTIEWMQIVP